MLNIIPRPYKLTNKIQYYEWGTKNEEAVIPKLIGIVPEPEVPYAELWIGAHPKAPSQIEINGKQVTLNEVIAENPTDILGDYVLNKFGANFPFLLKVLSAAKALSIQAHPNKEQAKALHASDPANYPDDNHKPEIAIAIDSLMALAGFKPFSEILNNLERHPELYSFSEKKNFVISNGDKPEEKIKELYAGVMKSAEDNDKLKLVIDAIIDRLSKQDGNKIEEQQFLEQYKLYGYDIGLISFFFYNIVSLKQHQAIYTGAGIPHAYIKGNIIECMANSDNVVRAGLTPKFKDVKTLLEIIKYDFKEFDIINTAQQKDEVTFNTEAEEFRLSLFNKDKGASKKISMNNKPAVILITEGEIMASWQEAGKQESQVFTKGESFLLPAALDEVVLSFENNSLFYLVEIPEEVI